DISRFKGLGEINDDEFAEFIGPNMRLDPVLLDENISLKKDHTIADLLEFYMGTNTMTRQNFIIDNLIVEDDTEL
ncbi:MAG TPA: DNA topoisomerase IV, partial [Porphyromonadaceae bacterium]|nr:DNA topoisomerase IV [Porphyromonadaceae bacterium]